MIAVGEQVRGLLTSTGEYIAAGDREPRQLPEKQWRQHRWVAAAAFVLSQEQAEAAHEPGNQVYMDGSNLMYVMIGCWDCEQPYPLVHDKRCSVAQSAQR